jgi:formylglycine-generating enzyme required for sulfatase activity
MPPKKTDKDHSTRAELHGSGAVAQGDGAVAANGGGVAVGRDVHGDVIVNVRGENVRDKELAYLDGLLKRYEYWQDHYTPLAGIAEVRAAVEDGPRLDLPMPFIPREFEKLVEHGYGPKTEVQREPVDDLRTAVREHRRVILLGDPGSGKTTTLWRMAHDYATAARDDARAPLPVLVPLGGYTDDEPFEAYLGRHLGPLASYLDTYRASGRLILLLDGLNEMPQAGYAERVRRIQETLDRCTNQSEIVVVTCRPLDYVVKLKRLQKVEVAPLDGVRIHAFLRNYLGDATGERLFWRMAGDEVRELWETWRQSEETWEAFWTAKEMPDNVSVNTTWRQDWLWRELREEFPPLLAMGRNPYLLLMTAQVYAGAGGRLPRNRAQMFRAFVDTLLGREKERHPKAWIAIERQKEALSALAYAMQAERGRGTTVEREWAAERLCSAVPQCDPERVLYLTTSATLLDADDATVRFYHQLLQEYFAAREMGQRAEAGEALTRYWPPDRWWEPSGWEETAILMAGMAEDATELLERLAQANSVVAARCLLEGEPEVDDGVKSLVASALIEAMTGEKALAEARAQAGRALAKLGDPRPGVGLREDGLPDIVWCEVSAGPFTMGTREEDIPALLEDLGGWREWYEREVPQHEYEIEHLYAISRYPVTNAQYAAFVQAGGYAERRYWTEDGWSWRESEGVTGPEEYGTPYNLPNHPVVGVSWYEAIAFCRWLEEQLQVTGGKLQVRDRDDGLREINLEPGTFNVQLPTEPQWEKAARSGDGRIYPWGAEPDPEKANYDDTGIGTTSAVGCFPGGVSPYGVEELSGNVWEWCRTKWESDYRSYENDSTLEGTARRVVRGGAFGLPEYLVRCASRSDGLPHIRFNDVGFRVVVSPFRRAQHGDISGI